jgi:hypothetical protein
MEPFTFENQIYKEAKTIQALCDNNPDEQLMASSYETIGRIVMESIWRGESLLIKFPSLKEESGAE